MSIFLVPLLDTRTKSYILECAANDNNIRTIQEVNVLLKNIDDLYDVNETHFVIHNRSNQWNGFGAQNFINCLSDLPKLFSQLSLRKQQNLYNTTHAYIQKTFDEGYFLISMQLFIIKVEKEEIAGQENHEAEVSIVFINENHR